MLLRTVDPDETEKNWIGQVKKQAVLEASPWNGHGMERVDYEQLIQHNLLRVPEVAELQRYSGLQFIVPIKWALDELQVDCRPKDRMATSSRNYTTALGDS